jgi:broad specificity phosphatase PhoE
VKIYFVRHAESKGNAGGEYDRSMSGSLSKNGHAQAQALVERLLNYDFDRILVSPLERTVNTILPYLKKTDRKAEIWPELVEARGRKDVDMDVPEEVRYGERVEILREARPHVTPRGDEAGNLLPPGDESYEEGQRRVTIAAKMLLEKHDMEDITFLVVGHACSGARFLEALMKIPLDGRFQHGNTGITFIEQKGNGDFIMRFQNRLSEEGVPG